jgi:hypothetical protein
VLNLQGPLQITPEKHVKICASQKQRAIIPVLSSGTAHRAVIRGQDQ